VTLDPQDIEAIAQAVAEKLRTPAAKPIEAEVVGVADAMLILGANSRSAFNRMITDLAIKRIQVGRYRRKDLANALARRSLTPAA
jgi:hypothetical protein